MSHTATDITEFLHSRGATIVMALVLIVAVFTASASDDILHIVGNRGLLLPSANLWLPHTLLSTLLNLTLIFVIAEALSALNKGFNIMRSMTSLWATSFLAFECMMPMVAAQFSGATLMAAVFLSSTALLFTCYDRNDRTRRVFLLFFLPSLASLFQYGYMFYIPIFAIGLIQMRIMSLRTIIAALLGIITPLWILVGSGIYSISDISWPEFASPLSHLNTPRAATLIISVGFTALLGVGFFAGNVLKLLSYNARNRAFNGFMALSMIATLILCCIDYANMALYATLLAILSTYQIAHYFTWRRSPRSFIPIILIMVIAAGFGFVTICL